MAPRPAGKASLLHVDADDLDVISVLTEEWLSENEIEKGGEFYDDVAELQARAQLALVRRRKREREAQS